MIEGRLLGAVPFKRPICSVFCPTFVSLRRDFERSDLHVRFNAAAGYTSYAAAGGHSSPRLTLTPGASGFRRPGRISVKSLTSRLLHKNPGLQNLAKRAESLEFVLMTVIPLRAALVATNASLVRRTSDLSHPYFGAAAARIFPTGPPVSWIWNQHAVCSLKVALELLQDSSICWIRACTELLWDN